MLAAVYRRLTPVHAPILNFPFIFTRPSGSDEDAFEQIDVLAEMAGAEEEVAHTISRGLAHALGRV